jgi:hypothetical protein
MIAYNKTWLHNLFVQDQINTVFEAGCIDPDEYNHIKSLHTAGFYTPNIFIRIGLFLLTLVIAIFSFGLISLVLIDAIERSISGLTIFFGLVAYAALEFMIATKHHYQSGVDDALLWMSAGLLFGGVTLAFDASPLAMCCIALFIASFFAIRFADRLMTLAAFLSLTGILFFTCTQIGGIAKAIVPFVIMIASVIIYFVVRNLKGNSNLSNYLSCFRVIEIAALLSFYAAGNYFSVRELSNAMFNMNLADGQSIPFGNLFWAFTIITPMIYIGFGIKLKDTILVRCGLLLVAAMVFTIRYYYHVAPIETAITIGGIVLIAVAYLLIRYLKTPKHGLTYQELQRKKLAAPIQIESLIIAETFAAPAVAPETGTQFGGGSFGGAGAGSEF